MHVRVHHMYANASIGIIEKMSVLAIALRMVFEWY